jgi:hypothetical protein
MRNNFFGISIIALLISAGCSTKLNIDAPYKETMIIYGLLDQTDTVHYIKINKAYLGPGNALVMAQTYDSISYGNVLTVQLQQISNGTLIKTINLTRDSTISKPVGIFSYPYQVLYKTKAPLDSSCQYNLVVTNNSTHNVFKGSASLINTFSTQEPSRSGSNLNFGLTSPQNILWTTAINGAVYDLVLRFYYYEESRATHVIVLKYLDWDFGNQIATANPNMMVVIPGSTFFQYLESTLSPLDGSIYRFVSNTVNSTPPGNAELIFSIGSQDLSTYLIVSQPTNSITQVQPQYTDIVNGFGLFASRYQRILNNLHFDPGTLDSLYLGQYTQGLFCNPAPPYNCN